MEYLSFNVMNLFQESISSIVKTVIVEYPYVDKDYRSTYYNFYSKRHRTYDQFCFRLHFFEKPLESEKNLPEVSNAYLGSIVLRPTEVTPLGRTLLSPKAIRDFKGFICEASFENNLMGVPLEVKTFPHIMQDTDVTVCAHAVCWMIARYYSEKYAVYPERLVFDIAEAIKDFSQGRVIPSRGVTLGQVSEILTSIGLYPEVFVRDIYEDKSSFYDILYSYLESGIPVVAGMSQKQHAVAILGHGAIRSATELMHTTKARFLNAWNCIDSLIINDDNYLPFESLAIRSQEKKDKSPYGLSDIDGFVVPLYEKMYLSAENVLQLYQNICNSNLLQIPKEGKYVARIFMTSARSYKQTLRESRLMNYHMLQAQLEMPMPKFIWIIEITSPINYDEMKTDYRWIMDATANQYEKYPFLFIHDSGKMIIHDRALSRKLYRVEFLSPIEPYGLFEGNLRRYS